MVLDAVALDDVADPHVLVVLERHAALLARLHLGDFVLEALERRQLALMHDDAVADKAHVRAALHDAVGNPAAGDCPDLGNVEQLENLRVAQHRLAQRRRQHPRERGLHIVDEIIDDVVVADLDAGLLGEIARLLVRAHVEPEDHRLRGLGQRHVRLGHAADAAVNDPRHDFVVAELLERSRDRLDRPLDVAFEDDRQLLVPRRLQVAHHVGERGP